MEIIKKISKRQAWVQVDEDTAKLLSWDKDTEEKEMEIEGDTIKNKINRIKEVKEQIKEIKQRNGITN